MTDNNPPMAPDIQAVREQIAKKSAEIISDELIEAAVDYWPNTESWGERIANEVLALLTPLLEQIEKRIAIESRIDELKNLPAYQYGNWQAMSNEWIDNRIAQLKDDHE